ncbi:hypothetical protein KUW18_17895 [Halomonas sp. DP5Y7-2]|uniref:PilX N-terminal domain-containing pilus assembly protein n=1 Tax=Halomonas sp. DP5Y7-2 TaxID=2859076 RepID=UPI001C994C44|nr:PilX N-terminal domain-containing pilus assembly protein [Halomonas sp. DP5Y7-2]MBY5985962.1 hypothetical protein [Halomonas sp. DP5Y7-2]
MNRCSMCDRQRGAVLLVVLSLVAIASVIAMAAVQSSVVDERLAGNMRAMAQAQMAADWGAAEVMQDLDMTLSATEETCQVLEQQVMAGGWGPSWREAGALPNQPGVGYRWSPCDHEGSAARLVVGYVEDGSHHLALHGVIIAASKGDGGASPVPALPDGCDTVSAGPFVNYGPNDVQMCWNTAPSPGQPAPSLDPRPYMDEVFAAFEGVPFDASGCAYQNHTVLCDSDRGFDGTMDLSAHADLDTVIVDGAVTMTLPSGSYGCDVVATGQVTLNGQGGVILDGSVWANGISIHGDVDNATFEVQGALVSAGTVIVDHNVRVEPELGGGESADGTLWLNRSA